MNVLVLDVEEGPNLLRGLTLDHVSKSLSQTEQKRPSHSTHATVLQPTSLRILR
jgi:hypothetical protein